MDFFLEITRSIDKNAIFAMAGSFIVIGAIIWRFPYSGGMAQAKQINRITVETAKNAGLKIDSEKAHRHEEIAEKRMPIYGKIFIGIGLIIGVIASVSL